MWLTGDPACLKVRNFLRKSYLSAIGYYYKSTSHLTTSYSEVK